MDCGADSRSCRRDAQQQAGLIRWAEAKATVQGRSDAGDAPAAALEPGTQLPATAAQREKLRRLGCGDEPANRADARKLIQIYTRL